MSSPTTDRAQLDGRGAFTVPALAVVGAVVAFATVRFAAARPVSLATAAGISVATLGAAAGVVVGGRWLGSDRAQVAADPVPIVTVAVGVAVAVLVGRSVLDAQRDALAACRPGCNLYGTTNAAVDAVAATPGAIASVWVGPVPLGWLVLVALCLWVLRTGIYGGHEI